MLNELIISGIILMGGLGFRFGDDTPKQFHKISGQKIYLRTLDQFCKGGLFDEVILVCHPDWIHTVEKDVADIHTPKIRVVAGGSTRQESAYHGILASSGDYVVIHDAVRPFVTERILRDNVEAAIKYGAVDTCISSADTIVHSKDGEAISSIPDRAEYLRGQTPQSFERELILRLHKNAPDSGSSCECRLAREQNVPVHIVTGDEANMKITTHLDLFVAEQLLRMRGEEVPSAKEGALKGKKYVVTGGTSGIGKALVERLTECGARPIVVSRSAPSFAANLTSSVETKKVFEAIDMQYGAVDGLINCVGLLKIGKADSFSSQEINEMIAANFTSSVEASKNCHIKKQGHIINLSSSSFYRGRPNYSLYSSMKAAIVNFTQAYADERPDLRVNVVVPQRTNTPMRWANFPGEDPKTLLSPYEVADAIVDLLSSDQSTGTIFEVKKGNKKPKLSLGLS